MAYGFVFFAAERTAAVEINCEWNMANKKEKCIKKKTKKSEKNK